MSDGDGESYSSQPPALEDADLDDVSSNASFVSDDSDTVSIDTDASDDSEYSSEQSDHNNNNGALGTPFVVPLKDDSDSEDSDMAPPTAQNGSRVRRQSSGAGRLSAAAQATGGEGPRRRAPPRTKSGDGFGGAAGGPRRRAPARTKSSELTPAFEKQVSIEDDPDGDRKEKVLERNMARRQKSSEMLTAMQDATRKAPNRSKSSGAALQRRAPARTKSGDMGSSALGGDDNRPRRRAPARTKSGDGLGPRRRPPARTKSGDVS